jgi:ATP-dependent RNA helicase DOB1
VCAQCRVASAPDRETAAARCKPQLMPLIHAWCSGTPFAELCARTTLFEGSLTRHIRRLEEVLRQLAEAARAIGNDELQTKFEDSIRSLKRGLPFAASLYI